MHLEFDMPVSALQSVPFNAILNFFFFFPSSLGVVRVEKEMQSAILWLWETRPILIDSGV